MKQLLEYIRDVIKEAEQGNTFECVMAASVNDPDLWLQVTWNMINVSYPFEKQPADQLDALGLMLPNDTHLIDWEPQESATWEFAASDPETLAAFALTYLLKVYGPAGSSEQLHIERQAL